MKRLIFVLLFLLALALCFTACKKKPEPPLPESMYTTEPPLPESMYTITWKDGDAVIKTDSAVEGSVPAFAYTRPDTAEWDYTFHGWATSADGEPLATLPAAQADATYYAVVTVAKKQYTLTFESNGGSAVSSIVADYGTSIAEPTKPSKEGYHFVSWCTDASLTQGAAFPLTLTADLKLYASWNEVVDIKTYLATLTEGLNADPMGYIPESMRIGYAQNLVSGAVTDYTSAFVPVNSIVANGYGEQWHMILENLAQSENFFRVLLTVEDTITTTVVAFNNYFDANPSDTANYRTAVGNYNVTIHFDGTTIYYVLDFETHVPVIGDVQAQIAASMNVAETKKTVRIQLGDANALSYTADANSYTFAIKYLGVRRAYFSVERDASGNVVGQIQEYLTVSGIGIKSAADFYITDDYVSAVGNKADGIPLMDAYICELYQTSTGKLLGYEVRETKTVSLVGVTFNTLWFDLNRLSGISSIRYHEKDPDSSSDKDYFMVNGQSAEWKSKTVGGIGLKMASRRFDIEFRTQYFYKWNAATEQYEEIKAKVPMFFVQEENYGTLAQDVASVNAGVNLSVILPSTQLEKIKSEYATKVDVFIENKANMTEEEIVAYIGDPINFS